MTPAKKRTRRGSRGGRRRRKPAAAGSATEGEADAGTPDEAPDDVVAPESTVTETAETAVSAETTGMGKRVEPGANGSASETPRAPRRRRTSRIHVPGDPAVAPVSPEVMEEAATEIAGDPVAFLESATESATDLEGDSDGSPAGSDDGDGPLVVKRQTRRGSRGGRSRNKKLAVVGTEADAVAATDAAVTSVVEIPEADAGAADDLPVIHVAVPAAETAAQDESGDAGYVPMSEWLGDFDRR